MRHFLRKGFDVTVLDKRNGAAMGTSWGNASSLRESSFGAGAGPGAMPALLKSLYNHDGTYRLRLATLLADTWLWRWGLRFLKTCGDKEAISATETFLRDHSPYFNRLTYAIADAEGFAKSVDGSREAMVVFVDCGADGKSTSDGTEVSSGTANAYAGAKAKAAAKPPVPWAVTHALTPAEAVEREPALQPTLRGALAGAVHAPHDSLLDSHGYTTALAKVCADKYGVFFVHGDAGDVTSLARASFGKGNRSGGVAGVHTADGGYVESDVVVVATGAQAPRLLAPLGIDAPIYPVKGYSLTYDVSGLPPAEAPTGLMVVEPAQMYVSRMGNRLRFTSIAEFAGWGEDEVAEDCVAVLRHRAETLFPAATVGREPAVWAGGRPLTPDDRPISCRAPESAYAPTCTFTREVGVRAACRWACRSSSSTRSAPMASRPTPPGRQRRRPALRRRSRAPPLMRVCSRWNASCNCPCSRGRCGDGERARGGGTPSEAHGRGRAMWSRERERERE